MSLGILNHLGVPRPTSLSLRERAGVRGCTNQWCYVRIQRYRFNSLSIFTAASAIRSPDPAAHRALTGS